MGVHMGLFMGSRLLGFSVSGCYGVSPQFSDRSPRAHHAQLVQRADIQVGFSIFGCYSQSSALKTNSKNEALGHTMYSWYSGPMSR